MYFNAMTLLSGWFLIRLKFYEENVYLTLFHSQAHQDRILRSPLLLFILSNAMQRWRQNAARTHDMKPCSVLTFRERVAHIPIRNFLTFPMATHSFGRRAMDGIFGQKLNFLLTMET